MEERVADASIKSFDREVWGAGKVRARYALLHHGKVHSGANAEKGHNASVFQKTG